MNEIVADSPFSGITAFESAQRMALAISTSTLLPEIYRGKDNIGNVLIALEMTQRIGCSFMTVVQNLHIIHGRPSFSSSFLIATVNTCGQFTPIRFEFSGQPGTDERGCRCVATDKATKQFLEGTIVTVAMAKTEGWYRRAGSKWPTMTEQMLQYRAAAFWQRVYCPEISLGMHTTEELSDIGSINPEPPKVRRKEVNVTSPTREVETPIETPAETAPIDDAVVVEQQAVSADEPPVINQVEALRGQVTAIFIKHNLSWKTVKAAAAQSGWWIKAESTPFTRLPVNALEFLVKNGERIAKSLSNTPIQEDADTAAVIPDNGPDLSSTEA